MVKRQVKRTSLFLYQEGAASIESDPRAVGLRYSVRGIQDIDPVKSSFGASLNIVFEWHSNASDGANGDGVWVPTIAVQNALTDTEPLKFYEGPTVAEESKTKYQAKSRWTGVMREVFELQAFPFDVQELKITLISTHGTANPTGVSLFYSTGETRLMDLHFVEWEVGCSLVDCGVQEGRAGKRNAVSACRIMMIRKYESYVYNVGIFMLFVVSLSALSQGIPYTDFAGRLGHSMTIILTTVAFKLVIADSLPKVPYLTILDKYTLCGFIFVVLHALSDFYVGYQYTKLLKQLKVGKHSHPLEITGNQHDELEKLDRHLLGGWALCWCIVNIGFLWCIVKETIYGKGNDLRKHSDDVVYIQAHVKRNEGNERLVHNPKEPSAGLASSQSGSML
jgi:hypothetical protein